MAKKINIISITVRGSQADDGISIGDVFGTDDTIKVEKIIYEEHGYNKGKQGKFPSYVVFLTNSNVRSIIKEADVSEFQVEAVEEVKDTVPELPEEAQIDQPEDQVEGEN